MQKYNVFKPWWTSRIITTYHMCPKHLPINFLHTMMYHKHTPICCPPSNASPYCAHPLQVFPHTMLFSQNLKGNYGEKFLKISLHDQRQPKEDPWQTIIVVIMEKMRISFPGESINNSTLPKYLVFLSI